MWKEETVLVVLLLIECNFSAWKWWICLYPDILSQAKLTHHISHTLVRWYFVKCETGTCHKTAMETLFWHLQGHRIQLAVGTDSLELEVTGATRGSAPSRSSLKVKRLILKVWIRRRSPLRNPSYEATPTFRGSALQRCSSTTRVHCLQFAVIAARAVMTENPSVLFCLHKLWISVVVCRRNVKKKKKIHEIYFTFLFGKEPI